MKTADRLKLAIVHGMFKAKTLFSGGGHRMKQANPAAKGRVHQFTMKTIEGKDKALSDYKGHALLIVNVASECGLTPQYEGLEALQKKYGPRGLRVLGFPANEFGAQEPGSNQQILQFCKMRFGVTFDMFAKIVVKGSGIHPLYRFLTTESGFDGEIEWNFGKFLVDRDGTVVARFSPEEAPESKTVTSAIEKVLA
jgi:glutathione peroxidase